jgi:hypothetical protein
MRSTDRSTTLVSFADAKTRTRPKGKTMSGKNKVEENAKIWEHQITSIEPNGNENQERKSKICSIATE